MIDLASKCVKTQQTSSNGVRLEEHLISMLCSQQAQAVAVKMPITVLTLCAIYLEPVGTFKHLHQYAKDGTYMFCM